MKFIHLLILLTLSELFSLVFRKTVIREQITFIDAFATLPERRIRNRNLYYLHPNLRMYTSSSTEKIKIVKNGKVDTSTLVFLMSTYICQEKCEESIRITYQQVATKQAILLSTS